MAMHEGYPFTFCHKFGEKSIDLDVILLSGTRQKKFAIPVIIPEHPHHADRDPPKDGYDKGCNIIPGMEHEIHSLACERLHCASNPGEMIMRVPDNSYFHSMHLHIHTLWYDHIKEALSGQAGNERGMTGGEDEKEIVCGLEKAIVGNDRIARRRLLDRLVVLLFTTDTAAPALVSRGGVMVLLTAARDRDEKIRLHAIHALSRLADSGYADDLRKAGARNGILPLKNDPYAPVRSMAEKFLEKLDNS